MSIVSSPNIPMNLWHVMVPDQPFVRPVAMALEKDVEAGGAGDEGFEASTSEGTSRPSQPKAGSMSLLGKSQIFAS